MKSIPKKIIFTVGLVLSGLLVRTSQVHLDSHRSIRFVDERPVFLPKGKVLSALTMGYRGFVGDWLWINTVLYYGRRVVDEDNRYYQYAVKKGIAAAELTRIQQKDSASGNLLLRIRKDLSPHFNRFESRGLVAYVYPMLEGVTTVDPRFLFPYLFGGVYVLIDTGEIDASLALLEKGCTANPDSWELPFYLGWVNWMYRGDLKKTHQYLLEAVGKPGCRDFVGTLLRGVAQNTDRTDMTKLYLQSLLESTDSPDVKKRIETILQEFSKESTY